MRAASSVPLLSTRRETRLATTMTHEWTPHDIPHPACRPLGGRRDVDIRPRRRDIVTLILTACASTSKEMVHATWRSLGCYIPRRRDIVTLIKTAACASTSKKMVQATVDSEETTPVWSRRRSLLVEEMRLSQHCGDQ